jgi:hypothetical protein
VTEDDDVLDLRRLEAWGRILGSVRTDQERHEDWRRIARRWALVEAFGEWSRLDPARFHASLTEAETLLDQLEAVVRSTARQR